MALCLEQNFLLKGHSVNTFLGHFKKKRPQPNVFRGPTTAFCGTKGMEPQNPRSIFRRRIKVKVVVSRMANTGYVPVLYQVVLLIIT